MSAPFDPAAWINAYQAAGGDAFRATLYGADCSPISQGLVLVYPRDIAGKGRALEAELLPFDGDNWRAVFHAARQSPYASDLGPHHAFLASRP